MWVNLHYKMMIALDLIIIILVIIITRPFDLCHQQEI